MALSRQSVAKTLEDVAARRPVLEPVLRAFEPLLTAQAQLAEDLAESVRATGLRLPEVQPEAIQQGLSLLAGMPLNGLAAPLRSSAEKLLPLLAGLEAMAPHMAALEALLLAPVKKGSKKKTTATAAPDPRESLVTAMMFGFAFASSSSVAANSSRLARPSFRPSFSAVAFAAGEYCDGAGALMIQQKVTKNTKEN